MHTHTCQRHPLVLDNTIDILIGLEKYVSRSNITALGVLLHIIIQNSIGLLSSPVLCRS